MLLNEIAKELSPDIRIEEISKADLPFARPRIAGKNARKDVHGIGGDVQMVKIKAGSLVGFGWSNTSLEKLKMVLGVPLKAMFDNDGMLKEEFYCIEFPLLDLLAKKVNKPVYKLVTENKDIENASEFSVPVYDTSIYFDELHIEDNEKAVEFICKEVDYGLQQGHKHFKVKVGRSGMWMDIDEGLKRDIDIIMAIRTRIGKDGKLMVDANNAYNLNLTKKFMLATKEANLHWLEEAFHEDDVLYTYLKKWLEDNNIKTMIGDGEGSASVSIVKWAKRGLIDVLQYDLRGYGFFKWMKLAKEISSYNILAAPHNYGGFYGNYAQVHFAAAVDNYAFAEFDVGICEGVDTSAYRIENGELIVNDAPGFGLVLDEAVFDKYVSENGWKIAL